MDDEITAIKQVVATLESAQQNEDVATFTGLFRDDAIWTTAHGRFLNGRTEIAAFTARVLPGWTQHASATYEVVHVLFLRPDVAAVKVRQRPTTPDGEPKPGENEGSPMYVMVKEDGQWLLAANQNTVVVKE